MSVAVICCKMVENEFQRVYKKNRLNCPVFYLDAGLHNYPDRLHKELQATLDNLPKTTTKVFLIYGLCGKAVIGLKTKNYEIIMPKTDDCIALLLGGNSEKIKNSATYFVTDGWLKDEKSIFNEYNYAFNKYGKEKSEKILKRQFVNYKTLGILDTGCYDLDKVLNKSKDVTKLLNLQPKIIKTDCTMLSQMFSPTFTPTDNFLCIPQNSVVSEKLFFDFLN